MCMARVKNVVDMADVLLDSGSDVNVVSRGLVAELYKQGVTIPHSHSRRTSSPPLTIVFFE